MGRSMVYYCEICGEELKKARARFCTFCGRLYYNVRRLKSASVMTDTALFQHIMSLKSWQRFRGHVVKPGDKDPQIWVTAHGRTVIL
jgi:hypothetical protein